MKYKWYMMTFVMIGGFIVLLFLSSAIGNTAVTGLTEEFPGIEDAGDFEGVLLPGEAREECALLLTDSQYLSALLPAQLRDGKTSDTASLPAIKLRFTGAGETYHMVICRDGKVSVKFGDDQKFFLDSTGSLFRALYEEHLLSGGQALPETK